MALAFAACSLVVGVAQAVECKVQTFEAVEFTTCRVNFRSDRLQLYWRDDHGKPYARLTRLRDSLAEPGQEADLRDERRYL